MNEETGMSGGAQKQVRRRERVDRMRVSENSETR